VPPTNINKKRGGGHGAKKPHVLRYTHPGERGPNKTLCKANVIWKEWIKTYSGWMRIGKCAICDCDITEYSETDPAAIVKGSKIMVLDSVAVLIGKKKSKMKTIVDKPIEPKRMSNDG